MKKHQKTSRTAPPPNDRWILEAEVQHRIPVHRSTIHRWVKEGRFPAPVWIAANRRAWRESWIVNHMAELERSPITPRRYFNIGARKASKKTRA